MGPESAGSLTDLPTALPFFFTVIHSSARLKQYVEHLEQPVNN